MRLHEAHLHDLAARHLGTRQPVAWERMTDGVSTVVYRASRGDERFYLRILPEAGATFAPEVRAHQLARGLGCAVPEVLAYAPRDPVFGRSTMLTAEIPGRPLSARTPPAAARRIVTAAGRDLARLNSLPVDGFGWVKRDNGSVARELTAEHSTLEGLLDSDYRRAIAALPEGAVPGIAADDLTRELQAALDSVRGLGGARLVHGDFDTTHIFEHAGAYSGVIDFGEIRGMPVFYDLAHHLMHDRERLPFSTLDWLLEGYTEIQSWPADGRGALRAWSQLIAARALYRGLQRAPGSQIVGAARHSLRQSLERT